MKDQKKHKEELADLKSLKPEELRVRERDLAEQLFWLNFKRGSGQLDNPANVAKTKRALARVKTLMRSGELAAAKGDAK